LRSLKEIMVKNGHKDAVNIISESAQKISADRTNIFIVTSSHQLKEWKYDYSKVFLVLDYGL
jgi:hypothetical protein